MGNSAAASAKSIGWTQYNRVADGLGKFYTVFYVLYDTGCRDRFTDLFHGLFELQTVFCFFDGLGSSPYQTHVVFTQEACFFELHGKIQSCLASQGRQYAVRFFFQDQLFYDFYGQRLDVNTVCNIFIGHDRCRV